ncbi:MAG TPA: hypothetical protein VNB06_21665, partial [Thermoanaerobaculia bacterium]|nr:hypothetical protein [Thermoanaerobaculia bacterium]
GAHSWAAPLPLGEEAQRLLGEIGRCSPLQVHDQGPGRFGAQALLELERVNAVLRRRFLGEELRSYRVMQSALDR